LLTVKFLKRAPRGNTATDVPANVVLYSAAAVHVDFEMDESAVVRFNDQAITVGPNGDTYDECYVMNELGKTVESIR
jgi:hypothetical protein